MKSKRLYLTLLTCLFFVVQFSFANNNKPKKKTTKNAKVQKVFVLLKGLKSDESEIVNYQKTLASHFNDVGIEANFVSTDTQKDSDVFKEALAAQSQYLLVINQTHQYYIDGVTNVGGNYAITYFPLQNGTSWTQVGEVKMNIEVDQSIAKANEKIIAKFLNKL